MSALERQVLVCYDVASSRARSRLFDSLKALGLVPVQESVFWGYVRRAEERQIARDFEKLLDAATDKAFLVPVSMDVAQASGYGAQAFAPPPRSRVI
ncbi:MAG TPA: CRISPR-associated endonuclease Cas2 [Rudaea sp.]|nr:CRISPR-associated endonuclease Cas2 [Rudaea sp.]